MIHNIEFINLGDSSLILKPRTQTNNNEVNVIFNIINSSKIKGLEDIIKTKSTVGLIFNPYEINYLKFKKKVSNLIDKSKFYKNTVNRKIWKIPVCYSKEFGLDLDYLSDELKISIKNIVKSHKKSTYTVDMIGFLPGFIYLDGNNSILNIPRKNTPINSIPEGSIGIARNQTGIYNLNGPGGWNIIGKTHKKLFDKSDNPPIKIKEGDIIKFYEIDKKMFNKIIKQQ